MSSDRARAIRMFSAVGIAFLMVWSSVSVFSAAPPENRDVYMVSLDREASQEVFRTIGTKVLVDYDNGLYLVDATESQAMVMRRFNLDAVNLKNWRLLDLYPYDTPIDTSMALPSPPSVMKGFGWDQETYIVQFIGPYRPEWLDSIEDLGGNIGKLVPFFSAVVKMSPDIKIRVSQLPFIHWVGAYQPWFKISSELLNYEGGVRVAVMAFDDSQMETLSERLVDLGTSVMMTYSPGTIVAYTDTALLPWIVSMPEVMQIYRDYISQPADLMSARIHGAFESWYPARNGLPSSLTGQSPGPDGIEGTADDIFEVIGIQDSGLDVCNDDAGHPDFFMGPNGDRVIRLIDRTGYSCPDGFASGTAHGTYLAGSVVGNGFAWEYEYGYPTDDDDWEFAEGVGIAPEAKISFDGVQGFGGLLVNPSYWDVQYLDGAHIYLNSYGGPPGQDYGISSWAGDNRTDADNDRLVVFAAANEGPLPNTLSGHAQGKNGLSAGAILNYRADRSRAHDPNLVWESSSRGGSNQSYGRVKPDLVTVGTASISTMGVGEWEHNVMVGLHNPRPDYIIDVDVYNQNDPTALDGDGIPDYRYMTGTSVAAAQMSGLAMLVREYLREVGGISDPNQTNSQLVKALLINGAVRMDSYLYDYPGYDQGWGRIDLMQSLYPPFPRTNKYEESAMNATGTWTPSFDTTVETSDVPLKVTLAWVDSSGKDLHRDLNLRVTSPSGDLYVGNVYGTQGQYDGWSIPNPSPSDSNPLWDRNLADGWDDVNNVEQVEVEFPEPGIWSIEVVGFAIPSEAPFALVVSADFGPISGPKVELSTDHPLLMGAALNEEVIFPFKVTNSGSGTDNVFLSGETPSGVDITFESVLITDLQPRETVETYAVISAYPGAFCGANHLRISVISLGNTSIKDQLDLTFAVRCEAVPPPIQVTNGSVDELDPSVLTFNDGSTDHIFIAYRKTTPIAPNGTYGGVNVWVAHATLDGDGLPVLPFEHTEVSNWNDNPYNLKFTRISSGTYQNRVFIVWIGDDPEAVSKDNDSYGVLSYSDPPYDIWNGVVIERNEGRSVINDARTHIPVWRNDGTPGGELIWIWEYLAYTNPDAVNPIAVETWVIISRDGGETWPACNGWDPDCRRVTPFDNDYYFFPDACVDTRNVLWVFLYHRLPAGEDRNLMVRLYDDNGWQGNDTFLDPHDDVSLIWRRTNTNIQWPTCVATSEGTPNNRVYVTATNDMGGMDFSLFAGYLEGHYNTTNPPFGLNTTNTTPETSPNFHGPFGPMGESACNAEYDRRHIVNMAHTNDDLTWITYIENNNSYNETNLWTYSSSDGFQTWNLTIVTADSFAKGHQMTDSLTVNKTHHNVYEVFHMNDDNEGDVTYDVYLLIYHAGYSLTADAGPDQVVHVNDLVIFNGSGSSDPDGIIVDWMWDFGDGSPTVHGEIVNHTYTSAGIYTATLLVTDDDNLTDRDTALITVLPELMPPVSDPDGPYSGRKNFPVYLTGNGSYDPDGMIVDLEWNFGDGSPNAHGWWVSHTYSSGGSFNVTLTVSDNDNLTDSASTYAIIRDEVPEEAEIQDAILSGGGLADVTISWSLSPDDGGVEDDVVAYEIYYGTTYDRNGAGYALLQSVPSGTTSYTHSGGGHGDNNTYFYIVKAVDDIGQKTFGQQAVKFARNMPEGMQLISIPVLMSDTSVQKVFQTVDFKRVIYYDANAGKRHNWRTFDTRKPYNSLKNVNETMALWVEVTQDCYLTVAGLVPLSTTIRLVVGWNFIGYASYVDRTVGVSFAGATYQRVEGYDSGNSPWYLKRLSDSDIMHFGNGYWIHVSEAFDWTVTN